MHIITKGATSQSVDVFIQDAASAVGAGKTGLVFNTASLVAYYRRGGTGAVTAITLATLANAAAAWSSGGFVEIDAANLPGMYRLDVPNAVIASGVDRAVIQLKGAAGMAPVAIGVTLLGTDLQDPAWLLKLDWTTVTGEAARSMLNALRFLRNKWTLTSTALSVKKEDDSTEAWAGTVSTDAAAVPIIGSDPA